MKTFLILILSASSLAHAATPSLTPEPGRHAVGLRVVQQYDYSRVLEAEVDALGKTIRAEQARPIQTLVWYPAASKGGTPMRIADYQQVGLADYDFKLPAADSAKQHARWLSGPKKAIYEAQTLAVRDAAPAAGRYPVLIYAPSFASNSFENLDLCEYLASHGYVVIASRSIGARGPMMTDDVDGVEAQAADIAFLANFAQSLPQADIGKVAAAGFSWGGMSNVFAAARSARIKALISLDGSIRFYPKVWSAAEYVRPFRTPVPMLSLGARSPSMEQLVQDDKVVSTSYFNDMKFSDVYLATMHPMKHQHFNTWGVRFAGDASFGEYQRADVHQAWRSGALYIRQFLDAYLKDDAGALAFLKQPVASNGISPHTMSLQVRPATAVAPSESAFLRVFSQAQYKDAQAIYQKMTLDAPGFKLNYINLNGFGYQLLRAKNARGAVELFKLATHIEPRFANAFDSEGEAYEALGDTAAAIAAYEKAVAADKGQTNAMARIKALRAGTVTAGSQ